jgi:L-alanine-DL-glutamate epimerase-like enolase superfamily enzyme
MAGADKERIVDVTGVTVEVLQVPVEYPYTAAGRRVDSNWHVLARVTTDDGIEGAGYIVSLRMAGSSRTGSRTLCARPA